MSGGSHAFLVQSAAQSKTIEEANNQLSTKMADAHVWLELIFKGIVPVAIGSLLTLLGVWLQSKSESKRLKIQLEHDAEQREKERQMDLRREVFLGAAEALGKQAEYINLFSKVDFDFWKEQEILKGNIGAGNKIHLIAGIETIEAYTRANQCWVSAVLELSKKRLEFEEVKAELLISSLNSA